MRSFGIILCFCTFLLLNNNSPARGSDTLKKIVFSNSFKLSHGGLYVPKVIPIYKPDFNLGIPLDMHMYYAGKHQFMTISGAYERKVYKNLFAGVSYTEWRQLFNDGAGARKLFYVNVGDASSSRYVGQVASWLNYKMADLYLFYRYGTKNGRHYINAGAGASYCWGQNDVITSFWYNPVPPQDAVVYTKTVDAHYWGVIPYIAYDYLFWNNRLTIGPDIRGRFYNGRLSAEYNINFHLGVNF